MARHKAMAAAVAPTEQTTGPAENEAPLRTSGGVSFEAGEQVTVPGQSMGRHPRIAAGTARTATAAAESGLEELVAWVRKRCPERFERLSRLRVRSAPTGLERDVVRCAAALRCLTKQTSDYTDKAATGVLARYLASRAHLTGEVDPAAAMRIASVNNYLELVYKRGGDRSLHTLKSSLYQSGRQVYPREYPNGLLSMPGHPFRPMRAVIPNRIIAELYATAAGITDELGRRAEVLLDLGLGAGARSKDFHLVRGVDVTSIRHLCREVAVVKLPNVKGGGYRQVPVIDADRSRRILQRAHHVGDALLLAPGGPAERNASNRVNEHLKLRGHRPIDLKGLRSTWLLDVAERVPAALFLQLADVGSTQVLADHREFLPAYGIRAVTELLADGADQ